MPRAVGLSESQFRNSFRTGNFFFMNITVTGLVCNKNKTFEARILVKYMTECVKASSFDYLTDFVAR